MKNKKKHRDLFDLYPLAMAVTEMNMNKFFYVNDKFCELTRCTREEILDMTSNEFNYFSEYDRKRFITALNITGEINGFEKEFRLKNNAVVNTLMFSRLITDGRERYLLSIFCDVTKQKRVEKQHLQKRNNQAIVTLTSGIAHEFNNALAVITGSIELLQMDLPDNEEVKKYSVAIMASAQRMAETTKQIQAYSREGKHREEIISLRKFILKTLPPLNRAISPSVMIDTDLPENIPYIKADHTQIQMMLTSLLANASEALDGKGKINISIKEKIIDGVSENVNHVIHPGHYVCLIVEDKGKGMDEETKNRIFEPFFTTKFQGRGMGMAATYGIVKNHNGWIFVDSKLSEGTKVSIYLPAIEPGIKRKKKSTPEKNRGTGTILVIEDEEIILEISKAMLEKMGFHVLEARTGTEAIEISKKYDGPIDLALLDVNLPDMGGHKVFPHIKKARPDLNVVVCSGYEVYGPVQEILDAGAKDFIQKPFTFKALSTTVMKLIERRKNDRFNVARGAMAIPKHDLSKQGQIIDISRGGLAFYYNGGNDLTKEFAKLAISMSSESFYLDKIPCKIISQGAASHISPQYQKKMTRVGLQFGKLRQKQIEQLEHFLQSLTTDPM